MTRLAKALHKFMVQDPMHSSKALFSPLVPSTSTDTIVLVPAHRPITNQLLYQRLVSTVLCWPGSGAAVFMVYIDGPEISHTGDHPRRSQKLPTIRPDALVVGSTSGALERSRNDVMVSTDEQTRLCARGCATG